MVLPKIIYLLLYYPYVYFLYLRLDCSGSGEANGAKGVKVGHYL